MADAHAKPHHDYHLVHPSPWPIIGAVSALVLAVGAITWMHHMFAAAPLIFVAGAIGTLYTMLGWWRDVANEATHQGYQGNDCHQGIIAASIAQKSADHAFSTPARTQNIDANMPTKSLNFRLLKYLQDRPIFSRLVNHSASSSAALHFSIVRSSEKGWFKPFATFDQPVTRRRRKCRKLVTG